MFSYVDPKVYRATRIEARRLSGEPLDVPEALVFRRGNDPSRATLQFDSVGEMLEQIFAWGVPVTITPPDGTVGWTMELED